MNELTNGIKIYVEDTKQTYHTLNNWGLALGNNNYISDPVQETAYINVPFRDGMIDISETVSGRPIFKTRELSFEMGGLNARRRWDSVVSDLRNKVHGRICRLTLDNDLEWYWRGRVYINEFDRERELGTLKIEVPECEPYKYNWQGYAEPWVWDLFNFETGTTLSKGDIDVDGQRTVTIESGAMLSAPTFTVSNIVGIATLTAKGRTYRLKDGRNYFPSLLVGGIDPTELLFAGAFHVLIDVRSGSL